MSNTYPGVYMEEVSSGVRAIAAAGTSTAAFFGQAEKGPVGEVRKIFNFTQFQTHYGGFLTKSGTYTVPYLAHGVFQFFNNGGSECYVGRVIEGEASDATPATCLIRNQAKVVHAVTFTANSPGAWGNDLKVVVTQSGFGNWDGFDLAVIDGAGNTTNTYSDLSMDPSSRSYAVEALAASPDITMSVSRTNEPGVGRSGSGEKLEEPIGLTAAKRELRISIDGSEYVEVRIAGAVAKLTTFKEIADALQTAINAVKIDDKTPTAFKNAKVSPTNDADGLFVDSGGTPSLSSSVTILPAREPNDDVSAVLKLGRAHGGVETSGAAQMRPVLGEHEFSEGEASEPPAGIDVIKAFSWLDTIDDVSLIAAPGWGNPAVAGGGANYARKRPLSDCFYIADMPESASTLLQAQMWQEEFLVPNSYAAVYFPWAMMLDPNGGSEPIAVPPSGFAAGMYAQIDDKRGVWKAPAGTEAVLAGAVGLKAQITDAEQGNLNIDAKSVSVIRQFPAAGIVLWGSRTLSSDQEWQYIPVRRTAILLRVSLFRGLQWAVFEPNDADLWSQLRINITTFMMTLYRRNAFQGSTPADAFFVECGPETTTQADIDLGIVNVRVGFAPLKPAEFVVVKISQKVGQG